jgi:hypothetical protein
VVDQDNPVEPVRTSLLEQFAGGARLLVAKVAGGHERQRGVGRRQPDQRHRATAAIAREQRLIRRKSVREQPWPPCSLGPRQCAGHIGIVIAGHQGGLERIEMGFEPEPRHFYFRPCREVDHVTRDRDMIGRRRAQSGEHILQRVAKKVLAAIAMPVHIAGDPFGCEFCSVTRGSGPRWMSEI